LEQALEALAHLPPDRTTREQAVDVRCDLYYTLHPLLPVTQYEQILTHLRAAEALAEGLADQRRLGTVYRLLDNTLRIMQDYEAALVYSQRVHAIGTALGDVGLQIEGNHAMGLIYHNLGGYHQALEYEQQVLAALEGEPRSQPFGVIPGLRRNLPIVARTWMVLSLSELGAFTHGLTKGAEALQLAESANRPYDYLHVYNTVGRLHVRQGTLQQAISLLERGVALSQEADMILFFGITAPPLALAYALAGRTMNARSLLGQIEGYLVVRGEAYLFAGEVEEADRLVQRGLAHARDRNMRGEEARALWLLGEIATRRDPLDMAQAEAHYHQALALANELGMRPLQAHCHLGLGTLYSHTKQSEQARAELSKAMAMYREMEMTFWLPETEAALAKVASRR
jgi:tetratricopeptide (TPR) repeat protein